MIDKEKKEMYMKQQPKRYLRMGRNLWSQAWAQHRAAKLDGDWWLVNNQGEADNEEYNVVPRVKGEILF